MHCKRHAKPSEYRSAALRYIVWCLAPQLAVQDPDAVRYMGVNLVRLHWSEYMENISALDPDKRFEVVAWMMEHMDDVARRGWIRSDGVYVSSEGVEPWVPAVELDLVRDRCGLYRGEAGALVGTTGSALRMMAHGFAWPESAVVIHRTPLVAKALEGLVQEGLDAVRMRAFMHTPDAEGRSPYAGLMEEARTWNPPHRAGLYDEFSSAALHQGNAGASTTDEAPGHGI